MAPPCPSRGPALKNVSKIENDPVRVDVIECIVSDNMYFMVLVFERVYKNIFALRILGAW